MRIAALRKPLGMLLALGALAAATPAAASANAVYHVNTTQDGNLTNPGSKSCVANTDSGPKCTLRAAVEAANNQTSPTTINVPAGTYRLTINNSQGPSSTALYANNSMPVQILGVGSAKTIVDADFNARAFEIQTEGGLTISGIKIENGRAGGLGNVNTCPSSPVAGDNGGGILQQGGNLTLTHDAIAHNMTPGYGGGIANTAPGDLNITDTTLTDNTSCNNSDGIHAGGGIDTSGGGSLTIRRSTISGNFAAQDGDGGGVAESAVVDPVKIYDTTLSRNRAFYGGGIAAEAGGTFLLFGDLLTDNAATFGGGFSDTGGDQDTFTNTTLTGNTATDGGGIFAGSGSQSYSGAGSETLHFDTVTDNTGTTGVGNLSSGNSEGGVGTFVLDDTIVARGHGGFAPNCSAGSVTDNGHNLFDDTTDNGAQCGHTNPGQDDKITTTLDMGPLADNGGPTKTEALLTGSPALDTASDANCAAETKNSSGVSVDQREVVTRPQGKHCDIGAYEATPDLGLSGSAKNLMQVGQQNIVTYVINNFGPEPAPDSTFSDPGAKYKIDSASASQGHCTHSARRVHCHLGTIPAHGQVTITLVVTALTPGTITLHGFTNMNDFDSTPGDNHASVDIKVQVLGQPKLVLGQLGPACYPESSTIHVVATAGAPAGIRKLTLELGRRIIKSYTPGHKHPKKKTLRANINGGSLLEGRTYHVTATVFDRLGRHLQVRRHFKMCVQHKSRRGFTG